MEEHPSVNWMSLSNDLVKHGIVSRQPITLLSYDLQKKSQLPPKKRKIGRAIRLLPKKRRKSQASSNLKALFDIKSPIDDNQYFYKFLEGKGWTPIRGTTLEKAVFELWECKFEKLSGKRALIRNYCTQLRSELRCSKEILGFEWNSEMLVQHYVEALDQFPPIPWKSGEEAWNEVSKVCHSVYEIEVSKLNVSRHLEAR